ncbi:DUF4350 domain-containing protein [Evansella tamaricis]|uniref:DUF4350 domain-containing protein n=1 Tax=Evansella tamaricis TaxID=2069301 RepID=A0ABS6JAD3_9BACI|nr:DUF4350 domain-containing protein [Evansella tamaricis]MBU9710501.1 DUF4350 domain-containing protein [Evansella tamaricis]
MDKTKIIKRIVLWSSIFLIFFLISYIGTSQGPDYYQPYLSHSPSPTGTKAIFTHLENEKLAVERWTNHPELLLNHDQEHLLIMVEPFFVPIEEEMNAYKEFMERGNTILLFSENPTGMFNIQVDYLEFFPEEDVLELSMGELKYNAVSESPLRLRTLSNDSVLIEDEYGALAIDRTFGNGSLIISNTPEWMMNGNILEYEHASLILSLINEKSPKDVILFDEYIHGEAPTLTTLYPKGFILLMVQGAFVLLIWLWYRGKRFGPIINPREEYVRFSDEGLKATAAWYLRSEGMGLKDSLNIQSDYLKQLMQERWGVSFNSSWTQLEQQLEQKWKNIPKEELHSFIKGLDEVLERDRISKKEYLFWSKQIDQYRRGVEEE